MSWRFLSCAALFITCLLTANTIAAKLIVVGGVVLTAGIVIFPISYVVGDVLTEVWGYAAARRVIWLGFACNTLMVAAIWLGGQLPAAPFWKGDLAYEEILGHTPLIHLSKAEIIAQGASLGVDFALTFSCYDPTSDGAACGRCDACVLRSRGFAEAGVADPTRYRAG